MPDGQAAALKVAADSSEEADALDNEAAVLLALQAEWGKWVPPLLAAGRDKDECVVLATVHVPDCSHLNPRDDRDVLQDLTAALAAVHSHGIAHGDIRCENVLVQKLADGKKKVWLMDWGLAVLGATTDEQARDLQDLDGLFESSS
eukprot:GHUV01021291.1.p1 GENE.GHUV01021291.1~~GHUV01021291.1.p1  ORF type:complete len:146 (+),score=45.14 GHUV01021291.1:235-672(+)